MVERLRTDPLVQIGSILGGVTSVVALVTSRQIVVALGVAGLIYAIAAACFCLRGAFRQTNSWMGALLLASGVGTAVFAAEALSDRWFPPWWHTRYGDVHKFGLLQLAGILGIALGGALVRAELEERHRKQVQICPDCLEECPKGAHVCRWCGWRWSGPPTGSAIAEDRARPVSADG